MKGIVLHKPPIQQRTSGWWRVRQRIIQRWIDHGLGQRRGWLLKTDLFDEASGPYHHATPLPPGLRFLGIDVDESVARLARSRVSHEVSEAQFVVADVRRLPFASNCFGAVLSLSTLDHFDRKADIEESVKEAARVLIAGGAFLLTMDNPRNPEVALRQWLPAGLVGRLRADRFPLGRTLAESEGTKMLQRHHVDILELGYLIHAPRYISIRALRLLDRFSAGWLAQALGRIVGGWESAADSPLRSISGHYIAWIGEKGASEGG
jgi:SAM-dependent methyltransferase